VTSVGGLHEHRRGPGGEQGEWLARRRWEGASESFPPRRKRAFLFRKRLLQD